MANYPATVANNYCVYSVYAVKRRNYHRLGFRYFTAVSAIIVPQIVSTILKPLGNCCKKNQLAGGSRPRFYYCVDIRQSYIRNIAFESAISNNRLLIMLLLFEAMRIIYSFKLFGKGNKQ